MLVHRQLQSAASVQKLRRSRAPHFSIAKSLCSNTEVNWEGSKRQIVNTYQCNHLGQWPQKSSWLFSQLFWTQNAWIILALRSISTKLIEPKLLAGSKFVSDCIIAICRDLAHLVFAIKLAFVDRDTHTAEYEVGQPDSFWDNAFPCKNTL